MTFDKMDVTRETTIYGTHVNPLHREMTNRPCDVIVHIINKSSVAVH